MRRLTMRQRGSATATPTTADEAPPTRRLRLPTSGAALAVSIVALVVAMGGSAYAGVELSNNSVGTKQLQKGAVTSKKLAKGSVTNRTIARGAVTNGKIANGAVSASKINTSGLTVPTATSALTATSATNATNATSATTASTANALANVTYIVSNSITSPMQISAGVPSDTFGSVTCPTGKVVIAGGFFTSSAAMEISESQPTPTTTGATPNEWEGYVDNFGPAAGTFEAWAICTTSASTTITQGTSGVAGR